MDKEGEYNEHEQHVDESWREALRCRAKRWRREGDEAGVGEKGAVERGGGDTKVCM